MALPKVKKVQSLFSAHEMGFFLGSFFIFFSWSLIKISMKIWEGKYRALYMGELRKNTTSTGTITKKKPGYFGKIETVGTKKFFL